MQLCTPFEPRRHSLLRYQFGTISSQIEQGTFSKCLEKKKISEKKKQQIKQNFGSHNTVQCTHDVPSMTPTLSFFKTRERNLFRHVRSMIILA